MIGKLTEIEHIIRPLTKRISMSVSTFNDLEIEA
jgi:hypothetical protein